MMELQYHDMGIGREIFHLLNLNADAVLDRPYIPNMKG